MVESQEYSERQQREIDYHKDYARMHPSLAQKEVSLDVVQSDKRRWWNAYWHFYSLICRQNLTGKKVLVPGCGFGEDAVRLAALGGQVYAFDLSPEVLAIASQRAQNTGYGDIHFALMPAEKMDYPDHYFDVVIFRDILHHVDIARTLAEIQRVLKPGGLVCGNELYTHSKLQRIRESRLVSRIFYPAMKRFIYGNDDPYITPDEHKINENEFVLVLKTISVVEVCWFDWLIWRIVSDRFSVLCKLDRIICKAVGPFARFLAGRVLFVGRLTVE